MLADLDTARVAAFANADGTVLAEVDAPGSVALASDAGAVRSLAARGLQARGLRIQVLTVRPLSVTPDAVVLDVTDDRRSCVELVDARGPWSRACRLALPPGGGSTWCGPGRAG